MFNASSVRSQRLYALLILFAAAHEAEAQTADSLPSPLGLEQAVTIARDRRAEVTVARERALAAEQRPAIVSALDDPMVSPSVNHWPFGMAAADVSLSIEQRFPLSGVRSHRRRAAEAEAKSLHSDEARAALDVEFDAVSSFLMLYERRGMLRILEEQQPLAKQLVSATNARYQSGSAPQADVIRAEIEVARVEASLKSTTAQVRAAESMLNASLGRASGLAIPELAYSVISSDPPERSVVVSAALEQRPELRAVQAEITRADAEIDVMRSMYAPMAMVRAGPAYTMAEGPGAMLMVGVSIPLWRGKLSAGVSEAEAMARMVQADLAAMKRMTEGQAATARDDVAAARAQFLSIRDDVLPRVKQAIEPSLAGYGSGQLPLVSLVEAVRMLLMTRAEMLAAEVSLGAAWARLGRATGDLERTFNDKR